MKKTFLLIATLFFSMWVLAQPSFYLTGGYTFTRAPLRTIHEFIGLYNENPEKVDDYTFTHGFDNLNCLYGLYYGVGMNYNNRFIVEVNHTRKFNHTFAYYDPANNPAYLRVDIGFGISTIEALVLFPRSYGKLVVSPGIGMGFLSRKLYYWDDEVLQTSPTRKDMLIKNSSGSFSLDPMLQVSYKPFTKVPLQIVARTYYQAMFSKMSVGWLGNFDGYWNEADTASKKVAGGNLGIVFAINFDIPQFKIKRKPHTHIDDEVVIVQPDLVLNGIVTDAKNGLPVNAVITLYEGTSPVTSVVSQNGKFNMSPERNIEYTIEIKAFGYQSKTETLQYGANETGPVKYTVKLSKVQAGQAIVLENILFEKSSAVLLPESYPELDKLLRFLQDAPDVNIEIAGHTSSDGNNDYNLKLSQDRANSVAKYLIDKGIDNTRITAKGYGETMPVATNDTEEGRKLNRRVEFKILK